MAQWWHMRLCIRATDKYAKPEVDQTHIGFLTLSHTSAAFDTFFIQLSSNLNHFLNFFPNALVKLNKPAFCTFSTQHYLFVHASYIWLFAMSGQVVLI